MTGLDIDVSFKPAIHHALGAENVTIVKSAKGAMPIRRWVKNWKLGNGDPPFEKQPPGDLYKILIKKVKSASKGKVVKTVTFVWMQGEQDAKESHGDVYADSFKSLLNQLKQDLDRKEINFVIGRLSDYDMNNTITPHWTEIRTAQEQVAEADPRGQWVDTDDLNEGLNTRGETIANSIHYSVEGYKTLGNRFAEEAIKLIRDSETQAQSF